MIVISPTYNCSVVNPTNSESPFTACGCVCVLTVSSLTPHADTFAFHPSFYILFLKKKRVRSFEIANS